MSTRTRPRVRAVVPAHWTRVPGTRRILVRKSLEHVALSLYRHRRWTLGPVIYRSKLLPVDGQPRIHHLNGASATEATVDDLIRRLDISGYRWELAVSAEVIPGG